MHVRTGLNYTLSALQKDEMHFSSTLHTRYMNKYSNYSERATINHKKIFNKDFIFSVTQKVGYFLEIAQLFYYIRVGTFLGCYVSPTPQENSLKPPQGE